jgi:hypothetical protein
MGEARRPGAAPAEFGTKIIESELRKLQKSVTEDDDSLFDVMVPKLNVDPKKQIAKDLPKIEVKPPPPLPQIKRKPFKNTKKRGGPAIVDIEYNFKYLPVRLEAPASDIPPDFGYDYMTDQLVDLTWQFCRLTVPDN